MELRAKKQIGGLALVRSIVPHVEITDVRTLRLSARLHEDGELEGKGKVLLRLRHSSTCEQAGKRVVADVRFSLSGVSQEDLAKKIVEISAVIRLSYALDKDLELSSKHLQAFGKLNAVFNAWPYWRELVQSTIGRMGLPRLVVPVFRIGEATGAREGATEALPGEDSRPSDAPPEGDGFLKSDGARTDL